MTFAAVATAATVAFTCVATTLAHHGLTPAAFVAEDMMIPRDAFSFADMLTLRGAIEEGRYGPILTIAEGSPHLETLIRRAH